MRGLLQAIGRLCLRNEDAINMIAQDTRLVMFCGAGGTGLPASLYKVAQAWKDRKEAGTATLSLRVTLLMAVFKETLLRCQAIHKSTEDPQQAKDQEIMTAQGDWPYLLWDSANQRHAHNENRTALFSRGGRSRHPASHRPAPPSGGIPPFPLAEAFGSSTRGTCHPLHSRCGIEDPRSSGGLSHISPSQPECSHAAGCIQHATGSSGTVSPGQTRPDSTRQALKALRLVNIGNHCYLHAFLLAWLWSSLSYQDLADFPARCRTCLSPLAQHNALGSAHARMAPSYCAT